METLLNKLWKYNDWANTALIDSLLQQEQQQVIPTKSRVLLSHMMTTQTVWLDRIKGEKSSLGIWDQHELETCKQLHQQSSAQLKLQIDQHQTQLQQNIAYTNSQGKSYENELEDILLHIFNHATYHRGQIAQDLRLNGLEPLNTDYITFVR